MIKIALVTLFTPTQENRGGPSSLPYYLLANAPKEYFIQIYSADFNKQLSQELFKGSLSDIVINRIKLTSFCKYYANNKILNLWDLFSKKVLAKPSYLRIKKVDIKNINEFNPDVVWIYPYNFNSFFDQLDKYPRVYLGPDSSALHNYRALSDTYTLGNPKIFNAVLHEYKRTLNMEKLVYINSLFVFVGYEDFRFFSCQNAGRNKSAFLLHPHYKVNKKDINLHKDVLSVVFTGGLSLYNRSEIKNVIVSLIKNTDKLKDQFYFTFLGKGYDEVVDLLRISGFHAESKKWVEDYNCELINHDIQIFPISLGTGTKGKVLDALSTGLLTIGTKIAFENIIIRNYKSCIIYRNSKSIPGILLSIKQNPNYFENIAKKGRENILRYHDPQKCARNFFRLFDKQLNDNIE